MAPAQPVSPKQCDTRSFYQAAVTRIDAMRAASLRSSAGVCCRRRQLPYYAARSSASFLIKQPKVPAVQRRTSHHLHFCAVRFATTQWRRRGETLTIRSPCYWPGQQTRGLSFAKITAWSLLDPSVSADGCSVPVSRYAANSTPGTAQRHAGRGAAQAAAHRRWREALICRTVRCHGGQVPVDWPVEFDPGQTGFPESNSP